MDALIPVVEFDGEAVDAPAPYFGSQNASGGAAGPSDSFVPAAQDQALCWAIEVINSRPQPRDEYQEIVVASQYFAAIQPFAVSAVAAELDVLVKFTNTIVTQGAFTEGDEAEPGDPATDAFQAVSDFVYQRCLGIARRCPTDDGPRDLCRLERAGTNRPHSTASHGGVGGDESSFHLTKAAPPRDDVRPQRNSH